MRINKEGYRIICFSGVFCLLLWWLIYHLLVNHANISVMWLCAVLLLLFWFSSWPSSVSRAACASTMQTWSSRRATAVWW